MTPPLAAIRTDGGTQTRAALDPTAVEDYAERYRDGLEMPPIVVFYDGVDHWLADGFHRHAAALRAGRGEIPTDLRTGTVQDARRYAIEANQAHGVRLTSADKRRKVRMALDDPEWRGLSDREIGRRCGVDHKTVAAVRRLEPPWVTRRRDHRPLGCHGCPRDVGRDGFHDHWADHHGLAWEHGWAKGGWNPPAWFVIGAVDENPDILLRGGAALRECAREIRAVAGADAWAAFVRGDMTYNEVESRAVDAWVAWGAP